MIQFQRQKLVTLKMRGLVRLNAVGGTVGSTKRIWLALPPSHPLTRKRTIAVGKLEGEQLMVMKEGHCLGEQVRGFCDRHDLKPKISFRSSQLETIQALVFSGLGISLIPAMAVRNKRGGSPEYRALQSPRPKRDIVTAWPKQRPPSRAANEFLKIVSARCMTSNQTAPDLNAPL